MSHIICDISRAPYYMVHIICLIEQKFWGDLESWTNSPANKVNIWKSDRMTDP